MEIERDNAEESSNKGGSKKGRKLNILSALKKKELCEYKTANPNKSNEFIADLFGTKKSTVSDILKQKERWLSVTENSTEASKKHDRKGEWPN